MGQGRAEIDEKLSEKNFLTTILVSGVVSEKRPIHNIHSTFRDVVLPLTRCRTDEILSSGVLAPAVPNFLRRIIRPIRQKSESCFHLGTDYWLRLRLLLMLKERELFSAWHGLLAKAKG